MRDVGTVLMLVGIGTFLLTFWNIFPELGKRHGGPDSIDTSIVFPFVLAVAAMVCTGVFLVGRGLRRLSKAAAVTSVLMAALGVYVGLYIVLHAYNYRVGYSVDLFSEYKDPDGIGRTATFVLGALLAVWSAGIFCLLTASSTRRLLHREYLEVVRADAAAASDGGYVLVGSLLIMWVAGAIWGYAHLATTVTFHTARQQKEAQERERTQALVKDGDLYLPADCLKSVAAGDWTDMAARTADGRVYLYRWDVASAGGNRLVVSERRKWVKDVVMRLPDRPLQPQWSSLFSDMLLPGALGANTQAETHQVGDKLFSCRKITVDWHGQCWCWMSDEVKGIGMVALHYDPTGNYPRDFEIRAYGTANTTLWRNPAAPPGEFEPPVPYPERKLGFAPHFPGATTLSEIQGGQRLTWSYRDGEFLYIAGVSSLPADQPVGGSTFQDVLKALPRTFSHAGKQPQIQSQPRTPALDGVSRQLDVHSESTHARTWLTQTTDHRLLQMTLLQQSTSQPDRSSEFDRRFADFTQGARL